MVEGPGCRAWVPESKGQVLCSLHAQPPTPPNPVLPGTPHSRLMELPPTPHVLPARSCVFTAHPCVLRQSRVRRVRMPCVLPALRPLLKPRVGPFLESCVLPPAVRLRVPPVGVLG